MTIDSGAFRYVLCALRKAQSLSTDDLARRAGLSRAAITHLERGIRAPSYATACALADALGIGVDGFREGPNQRPVETGRLRDARLAALQLWHREESTARRLADEAGRPSTYVEERLNSVRRWCDECMTLHLPGQHLATRRIGTFVPDQVDATAAPPTGLAAAGDDLIDDLGQAAEAAGPAGAAPEMAEALYQGYEPGRLGGLAPELVEALGQAAEAGAFSVHIEGVDEQLPPGELTAQLLRDKAELHPLDAGDRKAFHQARRRADKAGRHSIEAVVAGYAAVRRHRENTRAAEKPAARIAQDRRSRSRPAPGPTETATGRKGRYRGRQD